MKKFILATQLFLNLTLLHAGIPTTKTTYHSPTQMLVARESWDKIEHALIKQKIPTDLFPFFESIAAEENWGHIGYHGANHGFRFYQDVIKFSIEEILAMPIKKDFQFLRWPGDSDLNLNSVTEFVKYWERKDIVDNRSAKRAKQLLSMNYGIYSNFGTSGSCSVALFARDKSASNIDYVEELVPFYRKLGISKSECRNYLDQLLEIFNKHLTDTGGILLQISESSHLSHPTKEAYNFADKHCYPAIRGGIPYDNNLVSVHYKTAMTENYINKMAQISDQFRLVINNQHTLNPNSHLKIKRWDLQDPKKVKAYETAMRNAIRTFKYDSAKMVQYHDLLKKNWQQVKK